MHLIKIFSKIVDQYPNNTALRYGNETQTYSELNLSSNALMGLLRKHNIHSGSRVGLWFNDPLLFINALLAVVKLNAIYVPFDKKDSYQNIAGLCQVADVSFFLHDLGSIDPLLSAFTPLKIERQHLFNPESLLPDIAADYPPNPVLYIMFTSSTTGKAKGVLINHSGISRFIHENNLIRIAPADSILQSSSISFDASSFEIWASLLNGATLVLIQQDFDFLQLGSYLSQYNITFLFLTTKLFETLLLVDPKVFENLKHLIFGGETCNFNHIITAINCLPAVNLIHAYGPTENTIFTTLHKVSQKDENRGFIPIGFPVHDTQCFVLDEQLNQAEDGNTGILYVSGAGVAHAYTDKQLTDIHFINHPVLGTRLYNTNDLVRYSPEFGYEYIGRTDRQVKLNGYRIELNLIENTVNQLDNIVHSAAVFNPSKYTDELVLFYTTKNKQPLEASALKNYLEQHLPWYSIPKNIQFIAEFPLNKSKKVDQKKLIEGLKKKTEKESILPNEIETIWKEVLQLDSINADDNFFNIGGDSLSSIVLISKINKALNLNLKTSYIIENPVFHFFASNLITKDYSENEIVLLKEGRFDCPLFLIPPLGGGSEMYYLLAKNLKTKQSVFSFNKQYEFDPQKFEDYFTINAKLVVSLAKLIAGHIIKSGISQKIIVAGFSLGGNIAVETSLQLEKMGIETKQIHLLDTYKFGNTVFTNVSELKYSTSYFKRILFFIKILITKFEVINIKRLLNFLTQNEINPQYIKNIPVFLYKCLGISATFKFVDPASLDWNSKIEQLKIISINSDHDWMLKEGRVEELAFKMDESIDQLLNELDFQTKEFDSLSKADLDHYLSKGWFRLRFGNHMFTDTKAPFDNNFYPIKYIRYKLDALFLTKSIKKDRHFKQNKRFVYIIKDFKYENEKDQLEPLYASYRSNINFDAYISVYSAIHHGDNDASIFNSKIILLYDNEKLIGASIFDIGEISAAQILGFYDYEYSKFGIGKYLRLLEFEYLVANNFSYYYPGFIFIGHPKMDYKLSLEKSGIEYYDQKTDEWLPYLS